MNLTRAAIVVASLLASPAFGQYLAEPAASGLDNPVFVTHAPGDPDTLYILERGGDIESLDLATGTLNPTPFFSVPGASTAGEGGVLGLAFHPDYQNNGLFYVNLTTPDSPLTTVIREYTNTGGSITNPVDILSIDQPQTNHNAGWIGFNPVAGGEAANYLYVPTGDGGGSDDNDAGHTPGTGNAQDITDNLLGKILRIDVGETGGSYTAPASNPFVGETGDDEIYAFGLRNPFRASFDRQTGDLYIGDVGQSAREEIDLLPAGSGGGENFGWRLREGTISTPTGGVGGSPPSGNVEPLYDYPHGSGDFQGNTVTGGVLYRGPVDELVGWYIFGDFGSENLWAFDPDDPAATIVRLNDDILGGEAINSPVSFGEDAAGNLYIVDFGEFDDQGALITPGQVFRLTPEPSTAVLLTLALTALTTRRRKSSR